MSRSVFIATALILLGIGTAPHARTWYVAADGSGDAPTIAAAIDSTVGGDAILVGPGTHFVADISGSGVLLKVGTSLISEAGPTVTFLKPGSPPQPGLISADDNCVVSGFSVLGFGVLTQPVNIGGNYVEISNNIIHGASGPPSIAVGGMYRH
jgi:hypothetical protein